MHKPDPQERGSRSDGHDAAALIPVFGTLLLMPPILNLFLGGRKLGGIPFEEIYLLAVWLLVIAGALILSRLPAFRHGEAKPGEPETPGNP